MKTNVVVQRRETKTYEVEPRVMVDDGKFQVIVDKKGIRFHEWDGAGDWFNPHYGTSKPVDVKLVELALEWWKEIQ